MREKSKYSKILDSWDCLLKERDTSPVYLKFWYWYIKPRLVHIISEMKSWPFRLKHGFDYRDTWNLDYNIAKYILPRLTYLRNNLRGAPSILTFNKWKKTIDKMIYAFNKIVDEDYHYDKKSEKKIKEGLNLFSEYYRSLWD